MRLLSKSNLSAIVFAILLCGFLYFSYFPLIFQINPELVLYGQLFFVALLLLYICFFSSARTYQALLLLFLIVCTLIVLSLFPLLNSRAAYDMGKFYKFFLMLLFSSATGAYLLQEKNKILFIQILSYWSLILSALILVLNWGNLDANRFGQGIGNPIWIARMSGVYVIYASFKYINRHLNAIEACFAVFALSLMILTESRGPILSLAIVWAAFSIIQKGRISKKLGSAVALVIISIAAFLLLSDSIKARFYEVFDFENSIRYLLYSLAIGLIIKNPLGWGAGGFEAQTKISDGLTYPHNLVLELLVEFGILFSIFFIFIILLSWLRGVYLFRTEGRTSPNGFFAALLMYGFINSMFSGDMTSPKEVYILTFYFLASYWRANLLRHASHAI